MQDKPLHRCDLIRFFNTTERGLPRILRELDLRLVGGTTRWSVVWRTLGLKEGQDPVEVDDLREPLLRAADVASLLGVSTSIIYRWEKGKLPKGQKPFPNSIDLSNGRRNSRAKRWRKAEVLAWHTGKPIPRYAKAAPAFGALIPNK